MIKKSRVLFFVIIFVCVSTFFAYSSAEGEDDATTQVTQEESQEDNEDAQDTEFVALQQDDAGDDVIMLQLRLRDLGYYNYKITNIFGAFTKEALKEFQSVNNLSKDGILGQETTSVLYSNSAKRKPVKAVVKPTPRPKKKVSTISSSSSSSSSVSEDSDYNVDVNYTGQTGALRDWFTYVNQRISRSEKIKIYAIDSGITFYIQRLGGSNHADIEPCTAADTAAFKKAHGGVWSWNRIAVVALIDGEWIAGSMNGQPHSVYNIKDNNYPGHSCLHFLNSRTHNTNAIDAKHQAMVKRAAGQ